MIAVVWGTRPEAIKLGCVVAELRAANVPLTLLCTGQHTDLLRGGPAETDLLGSKSLGLKSSGDVMRWTRIAERQLRFTLSELSPELVVVQGDTMSAVAGARAASLCKIPVAHVEAGVRSHCASEPWPEEGFRVEIAQLADWHYAPTERCLANLMREDIPRQQIVVTGNPGISAIARYTRAVPVAQAQTPTILITLHRRELLKSPDCDAVFRAVGDTADCYPALRFLWPLHPAIKKSIQGPPNLRIVPPLDYCRCVTGLPLIVGVLTDSGGLQEEASTLGVPCAVLRRVTDRPESVEAGVAQVFPPTVEGTKQAIQALATESIPRKAAPVFGDMLSASRIARHLASLTMKVAA